VPLLGNLLIIVGKIFSLGLNAWMILIFIRALLSWFPVSPYSTIVRFLIVVTDPILTPIRRVLPMMTIDFSPFIAIVALWLANAYIAKSLIVIGYRLAMG
jgi:YggT family protein